MDCIYEKSFDVVTAVDVRYEWAVDFGFLDITTGSNKYMELINKVYLDLTEPPVYNALINQGTNYY